MYQERFDGLTVYRQITRYGKLIKQAPLTESRRLPVRRTLFISHVPNCRLLDQKPPSGPRNPHAAVIIDVTVLRYSPERSRSLVAV